MTWGSLSRMYGLVQNLRRRAGNEAMTSLSSQDGLLIWVPPGAPGKQIPKNFPAMKQQARKKLRVVWPEDRLMWEYFRKHPEARKFPYHLNSFEPPFVKRFALRQLELMDQGVPKKDAYDMVSREMQVERDHLFAQANGLNKAHGTSSSYSILSIVQEEEERQLMAGLQQYRKRMG